MTIRVTGRSDIGRRRAGNEDYFAIVELAGDVPGVSPPGRERTLRGPDAVLIVADGIGGAPQGEVASEMAANVIRFQLAGGQRAGGCGSAARLGDRLCEAIQAANREIHAYARARGLSGMGTTVTAVAIHGDCLHVGHVGDSRAYLIHGAGIEQITHDHSLGQYLVGSGALTAEEAMDSGHRHVLIQAVGPMPEVVVESTTRALAGGDVLALCSDGLWEYVDAAELRAVVAEAADLAAAAERLVALANDRGGADNITVVLARVVAPCRRG